jgi:hypothetical protein
VNIATVVNALPSLSFNLMVIDVSSGRAPVGERVGWEREHRNRREQADQPAARNVGVADDAGGSRLLLDVAGGTGMSAWRASIIGR